MALKNPMNSTRIIADHMTTFSAKTILSKLKKKTTFILAGIDDGRAQKKRLFSW